MLKHSPNCHAVSIAIINLIGIISPLLSIFSYPLAVASPLNEALESNSPEPTEPWGRPKRRTSGGDRNLCQAPLVAIVPGQGNVSLDIDSCGSLSTSINSVTATKFPILWFYVPPTALSELKGELVILKNRIPVHRQIQSIPTTGGIVAILFDYPLKEETMYDWQFSVLKDPNHPTKNPTVESTIQYLPYSAELLNQFASISNPLEKAIFQLNQNRWQDALHTLTQNYCQHSQQSEAQLSWLTILKKIELLGLAATPVAHCQMSTHSTTPPTQN